MERIVPDAPEEKLTCAGWPAFVNTETCRGNCELYEFWYCIGDRDKDPAFVENCREGMCKRSEVRFWCCLVKSEMGQRANGLTVS